MLDQIYIEMQEKRDVYQAIYTATEWWLNKNPLKHNEVVNTIIKEITSGDLKITKKSKLTSPHMKKQQTQIQDNYCNATDPKMNTIGKHQK